MAYFTYIQKILFQHCDTAGIVFYPRYFEMINATVEAWFDEGLNVPFSELHLQRGSAIPTVTIDTTFLAPSRLGDVLTISLHITKLGRSSMGLSITGADQGASQNAGRFETTLTLVHTNLETGRPQSWPDDIRATFETLIKDKS